MNSTKELFLLAVEGGATATCWRLYHTYNNKRILLKKGALGCGNWKILSFSGTRALLSTLPRESDIVGVFLAGCATTKDRVALQELCEQFWPSAEIIVVGSDRESGYSAAFQQNDGILVIAGTGSAVTGKKGGQVETAAGWGQLLGDPGSGFALTVQALRGALRQFDLEYVISPFLKSILDYLSVSSVRELTDWAEQAGKADLAGLVPVLFHHKNDSEISTILASGASLLADCCSVVSHRLKEDSPCVRLMGGIFIHHQEYRDLFQTALVRHLPQAKVELNQEPGVEGAAWLALQARKNSSVREIRPPCSLVITEEKNLRSQGWESLPTPRLVQLFVDEETCIQEALQGAVDSLSRAIDAVTEKLSKGGHLFYVGAGTSGRLGVLDAAEMPPTFGVPPSMVQSVLAGGANALVQSSEAKEDEEEAAVAALHTSGLTEQDVICAITASGTTPFALGAIREAIRIKALSLLITCTTARVSGICPNIEIRLLTGPELLAGSTRLKAGTATKVALNILSTGVMIRLGRVRDNSMAYLHPSNQKLRQRAIRILSETLNISESKALRKLQDANWNLAILLNKIEK